MRLFSLFIFLIIFWKPIYYISRAVYSKFISKDDTHSYYLEQLVNWAKQLVELVKP